MLEEFFRGEEGVCDHFEWNLGNLMVQLVSYAMGCYMGRYRLDRPGLNIAHYPEDEELAAYDMGGWRFRIDDDGIIPLMTRENPFEDDNALRKLEEFVRLVFGDEGLTQNLNYLEACLGKTLEEYLIRDFWADHLRMYQKRPIYWLFRSAKGSFQAELFFASVEIAPTGAPKFLPSVNVGLPISPLI